MVFSPETLRRLVWLGKTDLVREEPSWSSLFSLSPFAKKRDRGAISRGGIERALPAPAQRRPRRAGRANRFVATFHCYTKEAQKGSWIGNGENSKIIEKPMVFQ